MMHSLANELVIIGKWCSTSFHEDDLTVLESHEGHDSFRVRVVCEVDD